MESINNTLKRLGSNANFQKRYEEIKKATMQHPDVTQFIQAHKGEITDGMVEKSLMKLYEYSNQSKECNQCDTLNGCINMMQGYHPQLVVGRGSIDIQYTRCPRKVMADERKKNEKLIKSIYMPSEIIRASLGDIDISSDRLDALEKASSFVDNYQIGSKQKGLYFYGSFGVGKSYLLGAIANELAKKKVSSMLVYVPEFLREMKSAIGDSTLNEKMELVKKEPILMLDDIGAETMSSWTRDEVLGPILQFRMLENLPTFFTSNFDYVGLEHHLTYSQRGEEEKMKARRMMERIRYLSEPILVKGPNRRA